MRRPFQGLAWVAAALTIGAATLAHAAPQFYVVLTNDNVAAVIDQSTRSRSGDIVRFNLHLLRRQPAPAGAFQAYWADGLQEVDCANHRSRTLLTTLLSLDRTRTADEPRAAFEAWRANPPNTDSARLEAFACRDALSASIRRIADLATFQRQYFAGEGRQERAAPPAASPPPVASAPPVRSKETTPPSIATAPFYSIGRTDQGAFLLRTEMVFISDGIVNVPSRILLNRPVQQSGMLVGWRDGNVIIDCNQHRWRSATSRLVSLDRTQSVNVSETMGPWSPIAAGSAIAAGETLMCRNRMAPGVVAVNDLTAYARESLANEADRAIAGAKAALEELRRNPPKIPAGPRYYVTSYDKDTAEVFDRASFRREGSVVKMHAEVLSVKADTLGGQTFNWLERWYEFDCAQHRSRWEMVAIYSLDHKQRTGLPQSGYSEWKAHPEGSVNRDTENLLCSEKVAPRQLPFADLSELQRSYFAFVRSGQATWGTPAAQPPNAAATAPRAATAPLPPPAPPGATYYVIARTTQRATLLRRDSIARRGDIATVAALRLGLSPEKFDGRDEYWTEATWQFDCVKHRSQVTALAMMPLDRSVRRPLTGPQSSDWGPYQEGSESAEMAELACKTPPPSGAWQVTDLTAFQRSFFATANTPYPPPLAPALTAISPRFVVTGYEKDSASIIDRGRLRRAGSVVQLPSYILMAKPDRLNGADVFWLDATQEYDCAQHRQRLKVLGAATLDRKSGSPDPDKPFDAWEPVSEPLDKSIEALVCKGQMDPLFTGGDDLFAVQRAFFAYARSGDELFVVRPAGAVPKR